MSDATQPSPQPAEDLERALAEIDAAPRGRFRQDNAPAQPSQADLLLIHWPIIRAALERLPQLEGAAEALLEGAKHWAQAKAVIEAASRWVEYMDSTVGDVPLALNDATARELEPYWDTKKALEALLAQPAPEKEGERG